MSLLRQVLGVAKSLTHQGKFSCMSLLGGGKLRDQKKSLETGCKLAPF